jgi:hypothetical protein
MSFLNNTTVFNVSYSNAGTYQLANGATVQLDNVGHVIGGDAGYTYSGSYNINNFNITADITVTARNQNNPPPTIWGLGAKSFQVILNGTMHNMPINISNSSIGSPLTKLGILGFGTRSGFPGTTHVQLLEI